MEEKIAIARKVDLYKPDHELFEPGELGVLLEIAVKKPDGTVTKQWKKRAESLVRQFFDVWLVQLLNVPEMNPLQIRDTGNLLRDIAMSDWTFNANALTGDATFGLVVGTGNVAPTILDYALGAQILHGIGAGQVQYGNVAFGLPASDPTTSSFTITRDFANASGGSITVNEIGLYVKADEALAVNPFYPTNQRIFMTIRDVIGGGIAVPNGQTLTINYRFQGVI